jgi:hypothetical protein
MPSLQFPSRYCRIGALAVLLLVACHGVVVAAWTFMSPTNCQNFLSTAPNIGGGGKADSVQAFTIDINDLDMPPATISSTTGNSVGSGDLFTWGGAPAKPPGGWPEKDLNFVVIPGVGGSTTQKITINGEPCT